MRLHDDTSARRARSTPRPATRSRTGHAVGQRRASTSAPGTTNEHASRDGSPRSPRATRRARAARVPTTSGAPNRCSTRRPDERRHHRDRSAYADSEAGVPQHEHHDASEHHADAATTSVTGIRRRSAASCTGRSIAHMPEVVGDGSWRRLTVAHLTTVDMSLRFLVLAQLRAVRDAGGTAIGISAPGPWVAELEREGIRHLPLESSTRAMSPTADAAPIRELWRILRREQVDVLHTHNPKPGCLRPGRRAAGAACRSWSTPCTVSTRPKTTRSPSEHSSTRSKRSRRAAPTPSCSRTPRTSSSCSDCTSRATPRLLGNGVDLTRFDPARFSDGRPPRRPCVARRRRRHRVVVGAVGRLVAEKGYPELFDGDGGAAPRPLRARGGGRRRSRQARRPRPRGDATRHAAAACGSSASATTSTRCTRPWTCSCSRRTARASRVRRWRRPRWDSRSSPPTCGAAARSSTPASPGRWCRCDDAAALAAALRALGDDPGAARTRWRGARARARAALRRAPGRRDRARHLPGGRPPEGPRTSGL